MNALGECYASLMAYVDEALPEVLRGSFEEIILNRDDCGECARAESVDVLQIENVLDAIEPNFEDYGYERGE